MFFKKAKVTPIFKKGEKTDINNYRPISVLPVIIGIFERHVSNCLVDFLEGHDLVYNSNLVSERDILVKPH